MNKIAPLGETIRDRRLALGYSLGQLATKVGKTASSIRAWERGEAFPTEEESAALASALDLDAALLVRLLPDSEVWQADPAVPVDVHNPWAGKEGLAARSARGPRRGATATGDDSAEQVDQSAREGAASDSSNIDDSAIDKSAIDESVIDGGVVALAAGPGDETDTSDVDEPGQPNVVVAEQAKADSAVELGQDGDPALDGDAVDDVAESAFDSAPELVEASTPRPRPPSRAREAAAMQEAMTEAVPVVPRGAVAVFETPRSGGFAGAPSEPIQKSTNPAVAGWDELVGIYHRVFDPSRRWVYRVRWVLLFISLLIMLRVLAWAASNLLDAIGDVLDSVSFTPSETPDVQN